MSTVLSPVNAAWLAAVIDCEGSIQIGKKSKVRNQRREYFFCARIEVTNNNPVILMKCKDVSGLGSVYERVERRIRNAKPSFVWRVQRQSSVMALLKEVSPYLIVKRNQAELMIAFIQLSRRRIPAERLQFYERMQTLNHRGV